MNKYILFITVFLVVELCSSQPVTLYINSSVTDYVLPCGATLENACPDIVNALASTQSSDVLLSLGNTTLTGQNNTNIQLVNRTVTIQGNKDSYATINLAGQGAFFIIQDSEQLYGNTSLTLQYLNIANGTGYVLPQLNGTFGGVVFLNTSYYYAFNTILLDSVVGFNNQATTGGILYIQSNGSPTNVTVTNSDFNNNNATNASIIFGQYILMTVSNTKITRNNAFDGLMNFVAAYVQLDRVLIDSNNASVSLLNFNSTRYVGIQALTLTNNLLDFVNKTIQSGFVKCFQSDLSFGGSSNLTDNFGASVIYYRSIGKTLTINNSVIESNSGSLLGGAISQRYGSLVVNNSSISRNTAGQAGGAIYLISATSATITNSTMDENALGVVINGTSRVAGFGSALYLSDTTNVIINGVVFDKNTDNAYGGPIFCSGSNVTMNDIKTSSDELVYCNQSVLDTKCTYHGNFGEEICPEKKSKLKPGVIAGIVIGSIIGLLIIVLFIYILKKRHHNRSKYLRYN
ncbi:hypothetical protein PPL_10078 [Heterostelium album PN500]|uniref:Right handed beta helix domain-containing protein n=1 Tax=Heterostelium pallidum (strain ATCC 26659 / Pp 5 / PN500) TaxID=670386 RepID=D3BQ95_HETP5|nr:hypothetical protein PPL_10078 [Heterostelium album PN500]EFA76315.1 hypothetical protein PPL_10078 [Heterostelium album PN500]|eukprot:XP_020428447.1 hypothetical protein PPL_10078 [Heterostelium album PN500]